MLVRVGAHVSALYIAFFFVKDRQFTRMKCSIQTGNEQSSHLCINLSLISPLTAIYIHCEIMSVGLMTPKKLSLNWLMRSFFKTFAFKRSR